MPEDNALLLAMQEDGFEWPVGVLAARCRQTIAGSQTIATERGKEGADFEGKLPPDVRVPAYLAASHLLLLCRGGSFKPERFRDSAPELIPVKLARPRR